MTVSCCLVNHKLFKTSNFSKIPLFNAKGLKLGHFAIFDMLSWFWAPTVFGINIRFFLWLTMPLDTVIQRAYYTFVGRCQWQLVGAFVFIPLDENEVTLFNSCSFFVVIWESIVCYLFFLLFYIICDWYLWTEPISVHCGLYFGKMCSRKQKYHVKKIKPYILPEHTKSALYYCTQKCSNFGLVITVMSYIAEILTSLKMIIFCLCVEQEIEAMDADDILARQVEQLDKEKKELQIRLKTQEKKVQILYAL